MPKRSMRDFVNGLKQQIDDEKEVVERLKRERAETVAKLTGEIDARLAKIDALEEVRTQMTPAPTKPKDK